MLILFQEFAQYTVLYDFYCFITGKSLLSCVCSAESGSLHANLPGCGRRPGRQRISACVAVAPLACADRSRQDATDQCSNEEVGGDDTALQSSPGIPGDDCSEHY
jgi:hypothetical protein